MNVRLLGSRVVARTKLFTIERLHLSSPHGGMARDVIRHPGAVAVLVDLGNRTLLMRQYRAPLGRAILEIPAGLPSVDDCGPEETARRELEEEVGVRAEVLEPLITINTSPGYSDEELRVYVASGIVRVPRRPDGVEEHGAELVEMSREEALAAVEAGEITDSKTIVALLAWDRRRA